MNGHSIRGHLDASHCHARTRLNILIARMCPLISREAATCHRRAARGPFNLSEERQSAVKLQNASPVLGNRFTLRHEMVGGRRYYIRL